MMMFASFLLSVSILLLAVTAEDASYFSHDDVSWAVHGTKLSNRWGAHRQEVYDDFMRKCRENAAANSKNHDLCGHEDAYRRYKNVYQPASVYNYTEKGFLKTQIPPYLFSTLLGFWEDNQNSTLPTETTVAAYHNSWVAAPQIMNVVDEGLINGGTDLYAQIATTIQEEMQEWTGVPQAIASVRGIRKYVRHSVVAPHLTRMPWVSSAILHLAQDGMLEDWVLEVYDHEGQAHNVTLKPGEMLLYEGHSVVHGRPYPLQGDSYANLYVHFEPLEPPTGVSTPSYHGLPPYIIPGTPWAREWKADHPQGWNLDPLKLAQMGDKRTLEHLAERDPLVLRIKDDKGWQPLHEAARFGHLDLVRYLVLESGVYDSSRLSSCLAVAEQHLLPDHPVIDFLRDSVTNAAVSRNQNRTRVTAAKLVRRGDAGGVHY